MNKLRIRIFCVLVFFLLTSCTSSQLSEMQSRYTISIYETGFEMGNVLSYWRDSVFVSVLESSDVTVINRITNNQQTFSINLFEPVIATSAGRYMIFIGNPIQIEESYQYVIPLARWDVNNNEAIEYAVVEESMFPADAVISTRIEGYDSLVLADIDTRSLVVAELDPNSFFPIDSSEFESFKELLVSDSFDYPKIFSYRVALEGSQPEQLLLLEEERLLIVRYRDQEIVSVLDTNEFREIQTLANSYSGNISIVSYYPAIRANTTGFLFAGEISGNNLTLFNVGDACERNNNVCYNDQKFVGDDFDRLLPQLGRRSSTNNENLQNQRNSVSDSFMVADKVNGSVFLGSPASSRLNSYEPVWIQSLDEAIIGHEGFLDLPSRIIDLVEDEDGLCSVGRSASLDSLMFICPNIGY